MSSKKMDEARFPSQGVRSLRTFQSLALSQVVVVGSSEKSVLVSSDYSLEVSSVGLRKGRRKGTEGGVRT